jgi:phage-related protein
VSAKLVAVETARLELHDEVVEMCHLSFYVIASSTTPYIFHNFAKKIQTQPNAKKNSDTAEF